MVLLCDFLENGSSFFRFLLLVLVLVLLLLLENVLGGSIPLLALLSPIDIKEQQEVGSGGCSKCQSGTGPRNSRSRRLHENEKVAIIMMRNSFFPNKVKPVLSGGVGGGGGGDANRY
jgi:hypothetical protein